MNAQPQDPRITLANLPVDGPLVGKDAEAIARALRHPADEVLFGTDAYIIGKLLDRSRPLT